MKQKDKWEFAHKYCGKVWYVCGMVMLPIAKLILPYFF
ncbi:MAG: SdpI family protein [Blautia sp.]